MERNFFSQIHSAQIPSLPPLVSFQLTLTRFPQRSNQSGARRMISPLFQGKELSLSCPGLSHNAGQNLHSWASQEQLCFLGNYHNPQTCSIVLEPISSQITRV